MGIYFLLCRVRTFFAAVFIESEYLKTVLKILFFKAKIPNQAIFKRYFLIKC